MNLLELAFLGSLLSGINRLRPGDHDGDRCRVLDEDGACREWARTIADDGSVLCRRVDITGHFQTTHQAVATIKRPYLTLPVVFELADTVQAAVAARLNRERAALLKTIL